MIVPKAVNKGEKIGLVTPASFVQPERLTECEEAVKKLGFEPVLSPYCFRRLNGYLAGTAKERAGAINQMFRDPEIKAILCLRGGYGASDVLPFLDYEYIRCHPKVFVGYSDISCIMMALFVKCSLITFHGPMVSSNLVDYWENDTITGLLRALSVNFSKYENGPMAPLRVISKGKACGSLIGGNLSVITNLAGTEYEAEYENKILFLEDIGESVPRLHRMLRQMEQRKIFKKVNGVLLGDFADAVNNGDASYDAEHLLIDFFGNLDIPVIAGLKCGHCKPCMTLPLGMKTEIDTEKISIKFRENTIQCLN